MSILGLILLLVLVGLALAFLPLDGRIKTIIVVVLALVTVAWLMSYFGLWGYLQGGHHGVRWAR
jgi:hypothetical protein